MTDLPIPTKLYGVAEDPANPISSLYVETPAAVAVIMAASVAKNSPTKGNTNVSNNYTGVNSVAPVVPTAKKRYISGMGNPTNQGLLSILENLGLVNCSTDLNKLMASGRATPSDLGAVCTTYELDCALDQTTASTVERLALKLRMGKAGLLKANAI
jgi:hypothetical protein